MCTGAQRCRSHFLKTWNWLKVCISGKEDRTRSEGSTPVGRSSEFFVNRWGGVVGDIFLILLPQSWLFFSLRSSCVRLIHFLNTTFRAGIYERGPGSVVGEISFFLRTRTTAWVAGKTNGQLSLFVHRLGSRTYISNCAVVATKFQETEILRLTPEDYAFSRNLKPSPLFVSIDNDTSTWSHNHSVVWVGDGRTLKSPFHISFSSCQNIDCMPCWTVFDNEAHIDSTSACIRKCRRRYSNSSRPTLTSKHLTVPFHETLKTDY